MRKYSKICFSKVESHRKRLLKSQTIYELLLLLLLVNAMKHSGLNISKSQVTKSHLDIKNSYIYIIVYMLIGGL